MNRIKNYKAKVAEIRKYVKEAVSQSRYEHSLRTAKMCKKICAHYGLDKDKGYLAGLAHDMCKKMDAQSLIELASKDGKPITLIEEEKPALLHGRAASVKIQEDFAINDEQIVQAIANHTFGDSNLCDLAKALYAADKIEPEREQVTKEYLKRLFKMSLNDMLYTVVSESIQYLTKKGKNISENTLSFLDELNSKRQNRG